MTTIHVTHEQSNLDAVAEQMRFTEQTQVERIQCGDVHILSSRVDDLALWGYATDPETGTTVVLGGRVAFEEAAWKRARELPYEGGLACRLILDSFLDGETDLYSSLNGSCGVLIYDPSESCLHLITDRMGVYPFYTNVKGKKTLSTHPDVLADSLDRDVHLDEVTIAEVLSRAESVFPYTYYEEIRQLAPSSHFQFDVDSQLRLVDETEYWYPAFLDGELGRDRGKLVRELADAIETAVQLRTHSFFDNPGVLLSGGIDSRACLFGMGDPSRATALTYTDAQPGLEFEIARKLAKTAGAEHVKLVREQGHYLNCRKQTVKTCAGMYDISHDHMTPFLEELESFNLDILLTGCCSDYFFKGLADNLETISILGYSTPFTKVGEYDHSYYLNHHEISDEYQDRVEERWNSRFEPAINNRSGKGSYIAEDLRMRPMSCEADFGFRAVLWRTLPWDHLLSDKNVLEVYEKVPIEIKKDSKFFEEVVVSILPKSAGDIINADTEMRLGASKLQRVYQTFHDIYKSGNKTTNNETLPIRSLEELATLLQSEQSKLRDDWTDTVTNEEPLFESILGYNPWSVDFSEWDESNKHLAYRIVTIHSWLRQRRELLAD